MVFPGPHISEIYRCRDCNATFHLTDVNKLWICPKCKEPVEIKVVIDGYEHLGFRLKPGQLTTDQLVTLDREHTHLILAITKNESSYDLALKNYRRMAFDENDFILVIDGTWYD